MLKICPRCAGNMLKICPWHARDMPKICPWYAKDMPMICQRYAWDIPKISPWYAQDMHEICPTYAHGTQKHYWRGDWVSNMDPRDASASKNLPVQELWWKYRKWKFFLGQQLKIVTYTKFYWLKTFIAIKWWFEMEIFTTLGPLSPHESQSKTWNKI